VIVVKTIGTVQAQMMLRYRADSAQLL